MKGINLRDLQFNSAGGSIQTPRESTHGSYWGLLDPWA